MNKIERYLRKVCIYTFQQPKVTDGYHASYDNC